MRPVSLVTGATHRTGAAVLSVTVMGITLCVMISEETVSVSPSLWRETIVTGVSHCTLVTRTTSVMVRVWV